MQKFDSALLFRPSRRLLQVKSCETANSSSSVNTSINMGDYGYAIDFVDNKKLA